jgi:hypothetical protein
LLRRRLFWSAALLAGHVALVYGLDQLGLVGALLSPGGMRALVALPLALLLFAVRFTLLFVMPGLLLSSLAIQGADSLRQRRAAASGGAGGPLEEHVGGSFER